MAVTPPCRTKEHPAGRPDCSEKQQLKNAMGNAMLAFTLQVATICTRLHILFYVENPDGSWMWRQTRRDLSWEPLLRTGKVGDWRADYCRFGTAWRKRTRFRTNSQLRDQRTFCLCGRPHVRLRGRCAARKMSFTKLAEAYPRKICRVLALGLLSDAGLLGKCRKLDIAACAKAGRCRIGEASHPGPRFGRDRPDVDLAGVELLEPATVQMRIKLTDQFNIWFSNNYPGAAFETWATAVPSLAVKILAAYGTVCYDGGMPLHYYRQLLAHMQRVFLQLRPFMTAAWEMVSKWELLQPTQHRPPLPEPLLHAMATLGFAWQWKRWTAVLLGCFYAVMRIGEFLRARRRDILTPRDVLSDEQVIYLKIPLPKTRRRGAAVQYATIDEKLVVQTLCFIWDQLQPTDFLYPGTPGAFRSRWEAALRHIGVGKEHKLTPGSLRGGGAVAAHKRGMQINDLMWRMRLQHQRTLSFYLQETTAVSILPALTDDVRQRLQLLRGALPWFCHPRGPAARS
eukprot:Skav203509  [mRNA]  locus=scaffold1752:8350:9882:+ [translate_table: standard]